MRKLNQIKAESYLIAVILLITVLMATIIGSLVFFAFSGSIQSASTVNDTYTRVKGTTPAAITETLNYGLDTGQTWTVRIYNVSATPKLRTLTTGYSYSAGAHTVTITVGQVTKNDSAIYINYYKAGYTQVGQVQTQAVVVFAMIAIVPLILVGGLMLKSLGFMGGGKEV